MSTTVNTPPEATLLRCREELEQARAAVSTLEHELEGLEAELAVNREARVADGPELFRLLPSRLGDLERAARFVGWHVGMKR